MALSRDDLYTLGKTEAQSIRPSLAFREGDVSDAINSAAAVMAEAVLEEGARAFEATYLDGARGDKLTKWGDDRYGIMRKPAVKATGQVRFTRSVNGPAGIIPAGSIIATARDNEGKELRFLTDASVSWALNEQGNKTVGATADLAGRDGNVAAGTITRILTVLFTSSFTVTNIASFVGGDEEESDEDYRERVRSFPLTLRRGTLAALEYGALQVPAVKKAKAVAELDPLTGEKTGIINLYVSDADGGSSPQMLSDVAAVMPEWEAAGDVVNVLGASVVTQPVVLSVTVFPGVTVSTPNIQAAVSATVNRLKTGQKLYRDDLKTAVKNLDPTGIESVNVLTPAGDVTPVANQLLRTSIGDVTVS